MDCVHKKSTDIGLSSQLQNASVTNTKNKLVKNTLSNKKKRVKYKLKVFLTSASWNEKLERVRAPTHTHTHIVLVSLFLYNSK